MKVFRRGGSGGGLTVPTILGNSKRYKPLFQVFLMEGDYSPVVDWEGVETELNARWLAKSLFDAVVTPFIADLKVYLKNTQLFVSALEVRRLHRGPHRTHPLRLPRHTCPTRSMGGLCRSRAKRGRASGGQPKTLRRRRALTASSGRS